MAFPLMSLQKGRLSCSEVVTCAFDLGTQEMRAYEVVNDLGAATVEEVARLVGRDPSVVYRNLQKLVKCGVVAKEKTVLDGGGYCFIYAGVPKQQVRARLRACVDDWHKQMVSAIDRF